MSEMNEIVRLAVDACRGNVTKYSVSQANELLREALIEANNGSTKVDYRAIRDGKCPGLFSIIEVMLNNTVVDGLTDNELFDALVDFRNVAEGDQNQFVAEDSDLFVVATAANGTQGIRRQRLDGTEVAIETSNKVVRIYEELNRVLAGRVDFSDMIARVGTSFRNQLLTDIYSVWVNAAAADIGGNTYYPTAGSYDPDTLLTLIEHVEAAANGQPATIIGTKSALRKLTEVVQSDSAKEELHANGFYGRFYGTPCLAIPQRHKAGTTDFVFKTATGNDKLCIIAGSEKPIKVVYEGDPLIIPANPTSNADLTMEYFYATKWGVGLILAGGNSGMGVYEMT